MLYYKVILASLKVLGTYSKIADIFKIKAVALLLKPLYTYSGLTLRSQSNISNFYGYICKNILL